MDNLGKEDGCAVVIDLAFGYLTLGSGKCRSERWFFPS